MAKQFKLYWTWKISFTFVYNLHSLLALTTFPDTLNEHNCKFLPQALKFDTNCRCFIEIWGET